MARVFVYDGRKFPDPDPKKSIEEVRQRMTNFFPELANADTKQRKLGEDDIIEFKKRVGVKGHAEIVTVDGVMIFPNRKGSNFFRWVWAGTNLFQSIRVGEPRCHLGYCEKQHSIYAGGNDWVANQLRNGICPICGSPTELKYQFKRT